MCKKLPLDYLRGQVSQVICKNPSLPTPYDQLSQSGYTRVKTSDYYTSQEAQLEELFVKVEDDDRPFVKVSVFDVPLIGLLDSGAHRSILGVGSLKLIKSCKLRIFPTNVDLVTASGQKLEVTGYVNLPICFNGQTKILDTLIVPDLKRRLLLGTDFWNAFGIVPSLTTKLKKCYQYELTPFPRPQNAKSK